MSNAIERYTDPVQTTERQLAVIERMAGVVAKSSLADAAGLRGKPGDIAVVLMFAQDFGITVGPSALSQIFVINGRPVPSAQLKLALAQRAGHTIWFEETNATKATICGRRRGEDIVHRLTVTREDYKHLTTTVWKNYPTAMLRARAVTGLFSMAFNDVLLGIPADVDIETHIDVVPDDEYAATEEIPTEAQIVDHTGGSTASAVLTDAAADKAPSGAPAGVVGTHDDESDITDADIVESSGGGDAAVVQGSPPVAPPAGDTSGGGEPGSAPQPAAAPAPSDPWPADLPPEGDDPDDPVVSADWVRRFAIGCRNKLITDDEKHALIRVATGGRVASSKQVRESEVRAVTNWFVRVVGTEATEATHAFAHQLDGTIDIVPREAAE